MSHRIVHNFLAVLFPGKALKAEVKRPGLFDDYIRRVRKAQATPVAFDELGGLGIGVVAEISYKQVEATLEGGALEILRSHAEPVDGDNGKMWRLHPLRSAKDAALLMLCGPWLPGPACGQAAWTSTAGFPTAGRRARSATAKGPQRLPVVHSGRPWKPARGIPPRLRLRARLVVCRRAGAGLPRRRRARRRRAVWH